MTYQLDSNEFTANELLQFLNNAYGTQINGTPFTRNSSQNWSRFKSIPVVYDGYKIVATERYRQLGNLQVFKLDGLTREDAEGMVGSFDENGSALQSTLVSKNRNLRPRKQRTILYFQTLEAAGKQYTKKTLEQATLPKYWKEAGIKRNQLKNYTIFKWPIFWKAYTGSLTDDNQPGNLKPSQNYTLFTAKVKEAAKIVDITYRHLIISPKEKDYYSFFSEGLL